MTLKIINAVLSRKTAQRCLLTIAEDHSSKNPLQNSAHQLSVGRRTLTFAAARIVISTLAHREVVSDADAFVRALLAVMHQTSLSMTIIAVRQKPHAAVCLVHTTRKSRKLVPAPPDAGRHLAVPQASTM